MEASNNEKPESSDNQKPKNISPRLWQKFQLLKNKRQDVSRKSRERKARLLKKQNDEEKEAQRATEKEEQDSTKKLENASKVKVYTTATEPTAASVVTPESQSNWDGIRGFLDCNSHLTTDHGKPTPKSGLEKKIDDAIEQGDFSTAEKLSDQLASREFGTKITAAIEARNFATKRKREDEIKKSKKKKKLHWGFEHKEKWEMKANM